MKRMTLWGVGPPMICSSLAVAVAAGIITWLWPGVFSMSFVPYRILAVIGVVLIVVSFPVFILSGRAVTKAFAEGRLVTSGTYAICRNPLYANWIILLLPAIALLCNSWLMFAAPLTLYVVTRLRIHREETYLEERFGQEFIDYRRRTNAIFPTICRRSDKCDQEA